MSRVVPLLDLAGGPREIGLVHGRSARDRIALNVRTYFHRFREYGGLGSDEIRQRAERYRQVIDESNREYGAAMRGVAEGSGQELLDIVALNVRYEILYSEFARVGKEQERSMASALGGCTSVAVLPERTSSGHLLLAQNWDWIPEVEGLVLRTRTDSAPTILGFTEAGIVGPKIGINDAGIGLAINGLVSDRDSWSRLRSPFHVRCWEILSSRTLQQALSVVQGNPHACSANFLIARSGEEAGIADIEASPEGECELPSEDGFLAHTNHFTEGGIPGIRQPLGEDRPSTYFRYERARTLLREATSGKRRVDAESLKRILGDHEGGPLAICRHEDTARPPHDRFETVVSVIMDLGARTMLLAAGPPCTARYRRYDLSA